MADLRMAKVVKVIPEAYSVDLVFIDTMARVPCVQVMTWAASQSCGWVDLPETAPPSTAWDMKPDGKSDIIAIVGQVGGAPVVLGFLHQQVTQLLFKEKNRRIVRHASDVYTSLNDAGDFEMFHPSGTYLRIAEDPEHEDLTGKDFDGKWAIGRNTERAVHVQLVVKNGGEQTALIGIAPTGKVTIDTVADVAATVGGKLDLAVTGNITSSAAKWDHTGDLAVAGKINATGNIETPADVKAGNIGLKTHKHSNVQPGSGQSGGAVA